MTTTTTTSSSDGMGSLCHLLDNAVLERPVGLLHGPADDLGGAGQTHAELAVVGEVDVVVERGVQDGRVLVDLKHGRLSIVLFGVRRAHTTRRRTEGERGRDGDQDKQKSNKAHTENIMSRLLLPLSVVLLINEARVTRAGEHRHGMGPVDLPVSRSTQPSAGAGAPPRNQNKILQKTYPTHLILRTTRV